MTNDETSDARTSSGVNISGDARVEIRGDLVSGDKIIGYSVEQVSTLLTQIRTTFQPKPFDGRSPYVGLDAFQEEDAERFFGRERWVNDFVARLKETRFLLIGGASGSGKSSLVRAGLIPALKKGALPGSEHWLYTALKPGRAPLQQLALAVARLARSPDAGDYLSEHSSEPDALAKIIESNLSERRDQRAVLFVDQFEEIFTQVTQENERVAFLNLLTHAATVENGRALLLITLRSDFVSNCATYPQLNALLNRQFVQVTAMESDELVSAIARPALQVGLQIDPDLIAQIINDMRGQPGALPLMQFALKDLFDAQQAKGGVIALTRADYIARGGIHKALERHADAEFATLTPEEQRLARTIFSGVIEIGRGTQDTRRTARFQELVPAGTDAAQAKQVVDKLATARLLTTDERDNQDTVTLAHEALIDAWAWLRRLVNENRDAIALQNEIAQDAQEWEQHQRDASYLYTGARLATAREGLAANKLTLGGLARAFIDTSVRVQDAARVRRQRITFAFIGGLLLVSLVLAGLAIFAFLSQQQAIAESNKARARELAAVSLNQLNQDPELALAIALEANATATTFEGQDALRRALLMSHLHTTLRGHEGDVYTAAYSPDGTRIVTASQDKTARIWDAVTGDLLFVLRGHTDVVTSASFSSDGKKIVTASQDNTARVWDVSTALNTGAASGNSIAILNGHGDWVNRARFSPDGTRVVTASDDFTARVWESATGKQIAILNGHEGEVNDARFSSDGARIVTASNDKTARVWDVSSVGDANQALNTGAATGKPLLNLRGHANRVFTAEFINDSAQILTASYDEARVWDAANGKLLFPLKSAGGILRDAQGEQNGSLVVLTDADATAEIWNVTDGKLLTTLKGHQDELTRAAVSGFTQDGILIATASRDRTARIWNSNSGDELAVLRGHSDWVNDVAFSPDGARVVTTSNDDTARVWDAQATKEFAVFGQSFISKYSPDGTRVLTLDLSNWARVWDAQTSKLISTLKGPIGGMRDASFSPDGKRIASAHSDGAVRIWDTESGKELYAWNEKHGRMFTAAFSPDSARVVSSSDDGTVQVWDSATGKITALLQLENEKLTRPNLSPDGARVLTLDCNRSASEGSCLSATARVWETNSGKQIVTLGSSPHDVTTAHFSFDGKRIVTIECAERSSGFCVHGIARVWDGASDKPLVVLDGKELYLNDARFSPDGTKIITVGCDRRGFNLCVSGTARIWDVSTLLNTGGTGKEILTLRGHTSDVLAAEFSRDGKLIATSSSDSTARIWDAATGAEQSVLRGQSGYVYNAHFSPDAKYVLVTSSRSPAMEYLVQLQDLIALAKTKLTRELTCQERVQYLRADSACPTQTP